MEKSLNVFLTCRPHVEDGDLSEVGSGLQGRQNRLSIVYDDLQTASGADVHLLPDLTCSKTK